MAAASIGAPGQPAASLAALEAAAGLAFGHRLFTVLAINGAAGQNQRYHSSSPAAYPVGGHKPTPGEGEFFDVLIREGRPRFLHDRAAIIRAFADHATILALGCESAVNIPVRWDGRTLGTVNLLHRAGWYREADAPEMLRFAALAVPALLHIVHHWPEPSAETTP
jgi:hypothetical protein